MHRVTITVDDAFPAEIGRLQTARVCQDRSEAIGDVLAGLQAASPEAEPERPSVAPLANIDGHTRRRPSEDLTDSLHHPRHWPVSTERLNRSTAARALLQHVGRGK